MKEQTSIVTGIHSRVTVSEKKIKLMHESIQNLQVKGHNERASQSSVEQEVNKEKPRRALTAKGSENLDRVAKELEMRLQDAELKIEDLKVAMGEKLDRGDYQVLASDKVTK